MHLHNHHSRKRAKQVITTCVLMSIFSTLLLPDLLAVLAQGGAAVLWIWIEEL